MLSEQLKINDEKTEFILIGTVKQLNTQNNINIKIGNAKTKPSYIVKNLGVEFDATLSFKKHVKNILIHSILKDSKH